MAFFYLEIELYLAFWIRILGYSSGLFVDFGRLLIVNYSQTVVSCEPLQVQGMLQIHLL